MKKEIKIALIILGIVLFFVGIIGGIVVRFNNEKNGENYITDYEYLYDVAVEYLKNQDSKENTSDHQKDNYHFFVAYDGFGITEKDDTKYAYMWILGESYYLDKNEVKEASGYSIFHKFTFKDNKVINVEIPKDGSEYVKSVKEMCPDKKMERKILNYDLKLSVKDQVDTYYSESRYTFKAKIVESYEKNIIVEVLDDSNHFKKDDKVSVSINRPTNGTNDYFVKGNEIEITFNGHINEIYPPQISAISTSLIG